MAASLVGKNTIDQLITRYCELKEILHSEEHIDNETREEFFNTKDRISATRAEEFLKSMVLIKIKMRTPVFFGPIGINPRRESGPRPC